MSEWQRQEAGPVQSPEATEPHGAWLQSLEAPTLPPGGVALPRDPAFTESQWLEITHENRLLVYP
jgi:hypothetical protein